MEDETIREEIEELKERVSQLETKFEEEPNSISRSMDLSTFVQEFDPDTHPERATAIAYYFEAYEEQDTFTVKDIRDGYEKCRFKPPANMSDVLNGSEDHGWVMRKDKDGQTNVRQLTKSGIKMVEGVMENGA